MKPLVTIYWLRVALGIVAASICTGYVLARGPISKTNFTYITLMNGLSIALVVYLISYYIIKRRYINKVEKPTKLMTTGIGIYFISWIVFWILFYTLLAA